MSILFHQSVDPPPGLDYYDDEEDRRPHNFVDASPDISGASPAARVGELQALIYSYLWHPRFYPTVAADYEALKQWETLSKEEFEALLCDVRERVEAADRIVWLRQSFTIENDTPEKMDFDEMMRKRWDAEHPRIEIHKELPPGFSLYESSTEIRERLLEAITRYDVF